MKNGSTLKGKNLFHKLSSENRCTLKVKNMLPNSSENDGASSSLSRSIQVFRRVLVCRNLYRKSQILSPLYKVNASNFLKSIFYLFVVG